MKLPSALRIVSTPTALLKPNSRLKITPMTALGARKFTATTRRPLLDVLCLTQTHTLICGIHDVSGLPWAATIPLVAFLVRIAILLPLYAYIKRLRAKQVKLFSRLQEASIALEKQIRQEHGDKSPQERQEVQERAVDHLWKRMLKQNRAQSWRTRVVHINVPIWLTMMETIRRMTGTGDGMLSLIAKPLTALPGGAQDNGPGTMDELIPMEPSLATEGMLWFDNLMVPDPWTILPFALSGIMFVLHSTAKRFLVFDVILGVPSEWEQVIRAEAISDSRRKILRLATLAIGPATLMFPSAMLLYWFSSSLAAVTVGCLSRERSFLVTRRPDKDKPPGQEGQNSKPKTEEYRPLSMKELRSQKRKK